MKRLSLILLLGAALLAQTGCDDLEDLVFNVGYYADPGYGWYDTGGYYEEDYWYDEWFYW